MGVHWAAAGSVDTYLSFLRLLKVHRTDSAAAGLVVIAVAC